MAQKKVGILTSGHFDAAGSDRLVFGGAERYGFQLTTFLREEGFDVEWWQPGDGWTREYLPGVPIHGLPVNQVPYQTLPALNQAFEENAMNVDYAIYFVSFLAYPQALEKSISISHGIYWDLPQYDDLLGNREAREEWRRRMYIAFSNVRKVVSVDTNTIHWANATFPGLRYKFTYLPNFADLALFHPDDTRRASFASEAGALPKEDPVRILFPRRLTSVRGVNEAAWTAVQLTRRYPNVEVDFVGRAHDDRIEAALDSWAGGHERIHYTWFPPQQMPGAYQHADIVVIPTKAAEGTSLSCIEAMASGCAVVATWVGGLSDLIIDGFNGRQIAPSREALFTALCELVEDPMQRRLLGQRAEQTAQAFSLERWKDRWRRVIREVFT
ncbi:MAG: glycosyltransferase family 4 protein [Firmicutes bacterium]|nr:glycosyltransferase family 4 protein [Bacillota bacterium]